MQKLFVVVYEAIENYHTKEPVAKKEAKSIYKKDNLNKHVEQKEKK